MATEAAEDDDGGVPPLPQPSPSTKLLDALATRMAVGRTRRAPNGARARIRYLRARCRGIRQAKKWMASACTAARTTHRPPDPRSPSFWVAALACRKASGDLVSVGGGTNFLGRTGHGRAHAARGSPRGLAKRGAGELITMAKERWRRGRATRQTAARALPAPRRHLRSAFGLVPPSPARRRPALQQHPLTACFSYCALLEPDARLSQWAPTLPSPCIHGALHL
ncbi:hypothetical protein BJ912DRAFT_997154 [Pholiota molesta]|nr:hypothetical protein BJ912DRAFT_997154 [Pholiota molesta]